MSSLPSDVLQRICSFLEDPDDLASCHLVDTRCVRLFVRSATSSHTLHAAALVIHPCISLRLLVQVGNMSYIYLRATV